MNEEQRKTYAVICKHDGIKARDIAREIPICSGDMLFNLFDEFIGFLG